MLNAKLSPVPESSPVIAAFRKTEEDTVSVSVWDVKAALLAIGNAYPELDRAMTVAAGMVMRLDSLRDHAKLGVELAIVSAKINDSVSVRDTLGRVQKTLGMRGEKHEINIQ